MKLYFAPSLSRNENGGLYKNGSAYNIVKKHEVAEKYLELKDLLKDRKKEVTVRLLAKEAKVSFRFANKVMKEVKDYGEVIDPKSLDVHDQAKGHGSKTLTVEDECVLLNIQQKENKSSLLSYRRQLFQATGTLVAESAVSRWFHHRHEYKGSLLWTNKVPIDKFKLEKLERYQEFIHNIRKCEPHCLKFTDEKHLKSAELCNRKSRSCPITGVVENSVVDPDFRNSYTITGFCGIDGCTAPMDFQVLETTNDAASFSEAVEDSIEKGFLQYGDISVLDNAAIHRYCEAEYASWCILFWTVNAKEGDRQPVGGGSQSGELLGIQQRPQAIRPALTILL
jgi:hypothetical protein